ncbi:MAG: zinc ABC transporter substrate-binding protein [Anaerolineae bacterium]|nr:zinc ABC transporter substrate-binding protein [Anaerolineae bacterium]
MMLHKHVVIRIMAGAVILTLVAALPTAPSPAQAQSERLTVIASFSILADIVANVAGEAATVESLMGFGVNPHAFEPSAQDVVRLSDADVVFVVGVNFEEGLLPVLAESAGENMVIVSGCVPVRPVIAGMDDHEHEHEGENHASGEPSTQGDRCEAHHDTAAAAFDLDAHALSDGTLGPLYTLDCGGDTESCDPHVWTDPVNAGLWALMIRDTLSERDPANASIYAANTDAYLSDLARMSGDVQAMINTVPPDKRLLVTNHLAFNYFAERFGLTLVGVLIPGGSTTSEPSVQDVIKLIETIQANNVPAIFTETTVSEDLAQQIASEAGAEIVRLYTGSLSEPGGEAGTYIDYTLFNAAQITNALQ